MRDYPQSAWAWLAERLTNVTSCLTGGSIHNVESIGSGWETEVVAFTHHCITAGVESEQALVARFFSRSAGCERARREYMVMQNARLSGIPAVQTRLLVSGENPFDRPFIVMNYVPGPGLDEVLSAVDGDRAGRLMTRMAAHLADLHRLEADKFFPSGFLETESADLSGRLLDLNTSVKRHRLAQFEPLVNWLESHRPPGTEERLGPLHGDYHPGNILLPAADGYGMEIVDWSFAEPGDPRLDLAWTLLLMGTMVGPPARSFFLKAYEEKAGIEISDLQFFEALKLGQRMLTLATWLSGSVEIPVPRISIEAMRGPYRQHVLNPYHRLREVTGLQLDMFEDL